jgi:hypothetical protein
MPGAVAAGAEGGWWRLGGGGLDLPPSRRIELNY